MNKRQKKKLRKRLEQRRRIQALEQALTTISYQNIGEAFQLFIDRMTDVSHAVERLVEYWRKTYES